LPLPVSLNRWERFGVVPEQAFALLGQGRCLLGLSRPEAASVLHHAREIFERLGATPALAETDALLEQTGDDEVERSQVRVAIAVNGHPGHFGEQFAQPIEPTSRGSYGWSNESRSCTRTASGTSMNPRRGRSRSNDTNRMISTTTAVINDVARPLPSRVR